MPLKPTFPNPQNGELDFRGAAVSTLSSPPPKGIPSEQSWTSADSSAEEAYLLEWAPAPLSGRSKPRWVGLALSLSLTGLVWLLKLEADPCAEAGEEQLPATPRCPTEPETAHPEPGDSAPARRGYPAWATGLLLMLGLAGVATLQQRQLNRPLSPAVEPMCVSGSVWKGARYRVTAPYTKVHML